MGGFSQGTLISPCLLGFSRLWSPLMLGGLWDESLEGRWSPWELALITEQVSMCPGGDPRPSCPFPSPGL